MTYFNKFPSITYDFTIKGDAAPIVENITDLCTRITTRITDENLQALCNDYMILEGESPEKIAYKLYNQPLLHWTILYINGISDLHSEWPLGERALNEFCIKKYGEEALYAIKHYEKMPEMIVMEYDFMIEQQALGNFDISSILEVTNRDYEERENELKRFIKVIKPEYIAGFVASFEKALA